jgi:hypothetical protein
MTPEIGREHLRQLRILKGGHAYDGEHGCTRACEMTAGTVEYICTKHGKSIYGNEACEHCLRDSSAETPHS